jgi:type I restriction enzyme S subunit
MLNNQVEPATDLPEGFKMTKLGPLPQEWEVVRLGEVAEYMKAGGTPKTSEASFWSGKIPFVKVEDVAKPGIYLIDTVSYITEQGLKNSNTWLVPKNSILLSMYGTAGEVKITGKEVAISQNVLGIIPKENVFFVEFAYYALLWAKNYTLHLITDITIFKHFTLAKAKQLVFPLPPLPEQRAIAYVLRTVQRAKEATERVIQATQELKKSLMCYLFTYGPVPVEEAEKVPLKETEIGLVPEHWKVVRLGEVVQKVDQLDPRKNPEWRFRYIDVSSIDNQRLCITGYQEYLGQDAPSRARKPVKTGDVIFATVRPYLKRVALVPSEFDGQICSTAFCVLRANNHKITSEYLFFAVSHDRFVHSVSEHQRGSSYPAVTDGDVLRELIPLPPLPEQRKIACILRTVDKKLQAEETRKQDLEALFKTLLHNLMTGKIRVKDLGLSETGEVV